MKSLKLLFTIILVLICTLCFAQKSLLTTTKLETEVKKDPHKYAYSLKSIGKNKKIEVVDYAIDFFDNDFYKILLKKGGYGYIKPFCIVETPEINEFKSIKMVSNDKGTMYFFTYIDAYRVSLGSQRFREGHSVEVLSFGSNGVYRVRASKSGKEYEGNLNGSEIINTPEINFLKNEALTKLRNEKKETLLKRFKDKKIVELILDHKVWIGMTDDMAKESRGLPHDVNRTVTQYGVHEQWIYPVGIKYMYFDDGKLTSWQEPGY